MFNTREITLDHENKLMVENVYDNKKEIKQKKQLESPFVMPKLNEIMCFLDNGNNMSWGEYKGILDNSLICYNDMSSTIKGIKNKIKNKTLKAQLDKLNELLKENSNINSRSLNQCLIFLNSQKIQKGEFFVDPVDGMFILYYKEKSKTSNKSLTISFSGDKRINFNLVDRKKGLTRMNGHIIMKDVDSFYRIDELFKIF